MRDRREQAAVWILRAVWASLPWAVGPAIAETLAQQERAAAASSAAWTVWAVGVLAALIPHAAALTALRLAAVGVGVTAVAALAAGGDTTSAATAVAAATAAAALAFAPEVGRWHVNGAAYPNERRFPLRPPAAVLITLPIAAVVLYGMPGAALAFAASGRVAPAAIVACAWVIAAVPLVRALHRLARRWIVFVPAGVVLHDHLALVDPVLFPRRRLAAFGAAAAATAAADLTLGAPGLALEIALREPTELGRRVHGRQRGDELTASGVLVTPTRPGAVLAHAASLGLRR